MARKVNKGAKLRGGAVGKRLGVDGRQGQEVLIESEFRLDELSEQALLGS